MPIHSERALGASCFQNYWVLNGPYFEQQLQKLLCMPNYDVFAGCKHDNGEMVLSPSQAAMEHDKGVPGLDKFLSGTL